MTTQPDTDAAPAYTPKDRTGYTFDVRNEDNDAKETYTIVTREADGVGIGAYHSDQAIDEAIAEDRAYLATVKTDSVTDDSAAQALATDAAGVDSSGRTPEAATQRSHPQA